MKLSLVISLFLFLIPQNLLAQPTVDTCVIWLAIAKNPECKVENLDSTLRGSLPRLVAPNHGNVLRQFTITVFNERQTIVIVKNNGVVILKEQLEPGTTNFKINAKTGIANITLIAGSYTLSGQVNVVSELPNLPEENPDSVYDYVRNCEFLIQQEFYEQAFQMLNELQVKYPESYEVWATGVVLHSILGNQSLAWESAAKAINLLPDSSPEKILSIINLAK